MCTHACQHRTRYLYESRTSEALLMTLKLRVAFPPDVDEAVMAGSLWRIQLRLESIHLRVGASCRFVVVRLPVADICVGAVRV